MRPAEQHKAIDESGATMEHRFDLAKRNWLRAGNRAPRVEQSLSRKYSMRSRLAQYLKGPFRHRWRPVFGRVFRRLPRLPPAFQLVVTGIPIRPAE